MVQTEGQKMTVSKKKSSKRKTSSKTKTIERTLKETQNILQMVINHIPQYVFWKDTNSVFLGCNKNFAQVVGLNDPTEIIGKTDYDLTNKEKADHFIEMDQTVIETNKPLYNMVEPHTGANGDKMWVNINKVPLYDAENKKSNSC